MRPVLRAAATILAVGLLAAGASPSAAQEPRPSLETESGFALLAYESSTGRLAGVSASSLPAGASTGLRASPGLAAAYAVGREESEAADAALDALREGRTPDGAARRGAAAAAAGEPLRLALLTPACESSDAGSGAFVGPVEVRSGRAGDLCWVAVAVQPGDGSALDRMIGAFRDGGARSLPDRLAVALEAALRGEPALGSARSAALRVAAPDGEGRPSSTRADGPLEGTAIDLQVVDHPRPAAFLRDRLRIVTARGLARAAAARVAEGAHEEALSRADSALELDPGSTDAWMQRGRALLYSGRDEAAEDAFRRMLELDPTMLRFLGDPAAPSVNRGVIPYAPRLLMRLDVYRRAYHRNVEFGPEPVDPGELPPDTAGGGGDPSGGGG